MVVGRESLCGRCGSSNWEQLSETESRCAECGLGRTSASLQAYRAASSEPLSDAELSGWRDAARERVTECEHVFASASFAPFGLDERWTGLRWFGGHGSHSGRVSELELAHGEEPGNATSTQIRVETVAVERISDDPVRDVAQALFDLAEQQVQNFWDETGVLPEEVRRALFMPDGRDVDPTAPWDRAQLAVDGQLVEFRVLAADAYWVAQASHGNVVLGIDARAWPLDATGLVAIGDLTPYAEGSHELNRRMAR